jgi:pimeloyl-ACP methyl ester carboxylesterase
MPQLALDDVDLHYQCMGEGEDVVLVHGLGANLAFWFPGIFPLLARRYRVTAYDLRGHGRSGMPAAGYTMAGMVGDLDALLDALQIRRAHLVGHSFGARVVMHYAAFRPERVATLTIADTQLKALQPPMRLGEWPHWPRWKRHLAAQGIEIFPPDDEVINFKLLAMFAELPSQVSEGRPVRARRRPSLKRRDMGRRGSARWKRLLRETSAPRDLEDEPITTAQIRALDMPVLALFGEYSHCLKTCEALQGLLPDCRTVLVPQAGHFHPAVKPGAFLRAVGAFLDAHPSARPQPRQFA